MAAKPTAGQTMAGRHPCPAPGREDSAALDAAETDFDGMDGRRAAIGSETTQIALPMQSTKTCDGRGLELRDGARDARRRAAGVVQRQKISTAPDP